MTHGRRRLGEKVPSLTVGALLCCPERQELYVQRRSPTAAANAGLFSMFGGHICLDQTELGYGWVIDCLANEIQGEAGIDIVASVPGFPESLPVAVMLEEFSTGSLQYTPLCLALTQAQAEAMHGSSEGAIVTLSLVRDVDEILDQRNWSPMGFCTMACWVAAGLSLQKTWGGSPLSAELSTSLLMGLHR